MTIVICFMGATYAVGLCAEELSRSTRVLLVHILESGHALGNTWKHIGNLTILESCTPTTFPWLDVLNWQSSFKADIIMVMVDPKFTTIRDEVMKRSDYFVFSYDPANGYDFFTSKACLHDVLSNGQVTTFLGSIIVHEHDQDYLEWFCSYISQDISLYRISTAQQLKTFSGHKECALAILDALRAEYCKKAVYFNQAFKAQTLDKLLRACREYSYHPNSKKL